MSSRSLSSAGEDAQRRYKDAGVVGASERLRPQLVAARSERAPGKASPQGQRVYSSRFRYANPADNVGGSGCVTRKGDSEIGAPGESET